MSAWEATAFVNGRNCDKLAFYTKNWLKSISTSNAPHFPYKIYNMHAWFFSQSERLKRRKVNASTILITPSLKWRWYHPSTIKTVLSVTISLQIIFVLIEFYAYGLAQWRNHVMVLGFLVSLKYLRPFPSSKKTHFQSEAKCEAIDMKMSFNYDANKTHFDNKGALSI